MSFNDPFDPARNVAVDPARAADGLGRLLGALTGLSNSPSGSAAAIAAPADSSTPAGQPGAPADSTTTTPFSVGGGGGASDGADPVPEGTGVSQGYGVNGHPGIDLAVPDGTRISAAISGQVTHAANDDPQGYGQWVEITGPDGTVTRYGHLSSLSVAVGQTVKAGAPIGTSGGVPGETGAGNATGAHLHFEVRQNGQTVDPTPWLAGGKQIVNAKPGEVTVTTRNIPIPIDPQSAIDTGLNRVTGVLSGTGDTGSQNQQQYNQQTSTTVTPGTTGSSVGGSTKGADGDPAAVSAFLAATRQHESGGDYTIYNQSGQSNASGAYQFLNSTWQAEGGSTTAAAQASPAEQDAVALKMAMDLFNEFHSWRLVAIAWYGGPGIAQQVAAGADPGSPQGQGGYLAYGDQIASMMAGG